MEFGRKTEPVGQYSDIETTCEECVIISLSCREDFLWCQKIGFVCHTHKKLTSIVLVEAIVVHSIVVHIDSCVETNMHNDISIEGALISTLYF